MPKKPTMGEVTAYLHDSGHLIHASHDINRWTFEMLPPPADAPKTMVGLYEGRCKRTGIKTYWPIDQVELDQVDGDIGRITKKIHSTFARFLNMIGQAKARAKLQNSRLILPRHIKHRGNLAASFQLLEKGDIDH